MTVDACCAQCCIPRRRRVRMQIRIRSKCISTCLMSAAAAAVRVVLTGEIFSELARKSDGLGHNLSELRVRRIRQWACGRFVAGF